ncbi:hypothetical protein QQ045_023679 [Rhodiola kirilowii]
MGAFRPAYAWTRWSSLVEVFFVPLGVDVLFLVLKGVVRPLWTCCATCSWIFKIKRILSAQLEDDVAPPPYVSRKYGRLTWPSSWLQRNGNTCQTNYKESLRSTFRLPLEISAMHGVLVEMAEHKKELEKKTNPILDTLRS